MTDASNTVQILVACAKQGIRLIQTNCLRLDRTKEMGSHINACAIYGIRFAPMNYLLLGKATETVNQIKVCVIYDIQLKEICPRGNNKVVIYISLYHDKCLLFMLELY